MAIYQGVCAFFVFVSVSYGVLKCDKGAKEKKKDDTESCCPLTQCKYVLYMTKVTGSYLVRCYYIVCI